MSLTKRWLDETQELTPDQQLIAGEIEQQAEGNYDEAIRYAAKEIWMLRLEDDRLTEIIRRKRREIQRLSFPAIYPPELPDDQEAIAERINEVAGYMVKLMEQKGMQADYDVTYNSLKEIASFGEEPKK